MGLFQGAVIAEHVDLAIKHMSDEAGVAIALIGNIGQEIDEDREQNESEAGEEKGFQGLRDEVSDDVSVREVVGGGFGRGFCIEVSAIASDKNREV